MRYFFYLLSCYFLLTACTQQPGPLKEDDIEPEAHVFLSSPWIQPYLAHNRHYNTPQSCFQEIRKEVPQKWWRYTVEGLYYNLPERPDSGRTEYWLDTAVATLPDNNVRAFVLMIRGIRHIEKGNFPKSIQCLNESYTLARQLDQPYRANDARRYLARCYMLQGEYPKAISLLTKVQDFIQDKSDIHQVRKFETMLELARVYLSSGDYNQGLAWGQQCLEFTKQYNTPGQQVQATESVAQAYIYLNQPDSARAHLHRSEALRRTFEVYHDSTNAHYLMGKTLVALDSCAQALPKLLLAASGNLEKYNRLKISAIKASLADCYNCLGSTDKAMQYYTHALKLTPDTSALATIQYKMADIAERQGLFATALHHTQLANRFFRIFFTAEKDRAIGKMESQLALERTEYRVKLLTAQQRSQRFSIVILCLLFLLTVTSWLFAADRQKRKRRILEQEKALLQATHEIQEQKLKISAFTLKQKEVELSSLQQLLELKNNLIASLEQQINAQPAEDTAPPLRMLTESDWQSFRNAFEIQFPGYLVRLKNQFPTITNAETRLFLFIKIGLESSEISKISGISLDSVYRNRTRLRQKLQLDTAVNLEQFILDF